MALTTLSDLINPQVMADMITGKIDKKIVVSPFAKIDNTLEGQAGNTITVPAFNYIGDAIDVAEGAAVTPVKLTATSTTFTVKKVMQAVSLTDEAVLSGYGNPVGEATTQLAKAIAGKVDSDAMTALTTAYNASTAPNGVKLSYTAGAIIGYNGIVNAVDLFEEEVQTEKVMFIHPKQVTQLRLDSNFISADKYDNAVVMRGEIGMIAGTRIVPSKRVIKTGTSSAAIYNCPIVKLNGDDETEDESAAITIYLKRDTNVETERQTLSRITDVSADKLYGVALTNQGKVVLAKFLASAS